MLLGWFRHYWALAGYALLYTIARPLRRFFAKSYSLACLLDAWKFGAGLDSSSKGQDSAPQTFVAA